MKNIIVTFFLIFTFSKNAFAVSFDCSKSTKSSEKTICNDSELSNLDDMMSKVYAESKNQTNDKNLLVSEQKDWYKKTVKCAESRNCLIEAYNTRINELKLITSSLQQKIEADKSQLVTEKQAEITKLIESPKKEEKTNEENKSIENLTTTSGLEKQITTREQSAIEFKATQTTEFNENQKAADERRLAREKQIEESTIERNIAQAERQKKENEKSEEKQKEYELYEIENNKKIAYENERRELARINEQKINDIQSQQLKMYHEQELAESEAAAIKDKQLILRLKQIALVTLLLLNYPVWLYIKVKNKGIILDFRNDLMEFPGGYISANEMSDYLDLKYWFQLFLIFKVPISQIREIQSEDNTVRVWSKQTDSFEYSTVYVMNINGDFGAFSLPFQDFGKRDQLYAKIREVNSMGSPINVNR